MRIRYIALMATLAASLLRAPTASACSLNPTAVISAPAAASSHIHGTAVGFNGATSTANCGTIIGYLWKNGNTTLSTSPTFNYTVTLAPEQVDSVITVSLKVTSSTNARTHTVYRTITIKRDHQSQYFVKDHLGSPRVVVDGKGAVLSYTDYYPFGMVMPGRAGNISLSNDRVKFTGYLLEEEGEQDTYHAEARGYDPVIGRFTSRDPLTRDLPSWSPYNYGLNNPLKYVDPDGRFPWLVGGLVGAVTEAGSQIATSMSQGQSFSDAVSSIDGNKVGVATAVGAASGGLSVASKLATGTKVGLTVGLNAGEGAAQDVLSGDEVTVTSVAIDVVSGIAGSWAGNATSNAIKSTTGNGRRLEGVARRAEGRARNTNSNNHQRNANRARGASNSNAATRGGIISDKAATVATARTATAATATSGSGQSRRQGVNHRTSATSGLTRTPEAVKED